MLKIMNCVYQTLECIRLHIEPQPYNRLDTWYLIPTKWSESNEKWILLSASQINWIWLAIQIKSKQQINAANIADAFCLSTKTMYLADVNIQHQHEYIEITKKV